MKLAKFALTTPVVAISVSIFVALGARAFGGDLPAGFAEIDYLDGSGAKGAYIDLGYGPKNGTRVDLRFTALTPSADVKFFSARDNTTGVFIGTVSSNCRVGFALATPVAVYTTENLITCYLPGYDADHPSGAYFVNGVLSLKNNVDVAASETSNSAWNYVLFGDNYKGGVTPGKVRFHSLKISNANGLVHDYIPVKTADSLGIYDLVTETFLAVPDATAFTAGPEVATRQIKLVRTASTYPTVEAAYDAAEDGDVVELAASAAPYRLTVPRLDLAKGVTIRGTGTDRSQVVVLPAPNENMYLFTLSHPDAKLENLTLTGGRTGSDNSREKGDSPAVKMSAGTVDNCWMYGFSGKAYGGTVGMSGGVLCNSLVSDNTYSQCGNSNAGMGGGVELVGGMVSNCVIRSNRIHHSGGGVMMCGKDALLVDSDIFDNRSDNNGSGVYMMQGRLERCRIHGNRKGPAGTGLGIGGTVGAYLGAAGKCYVYNCIIDDNPSDGTGAGVYLTTDNGTLENCTICNNSSASAEGGGVYQTKGVLRNCIVVGNGGNNPTSQIANDLNRTGGTMDHCLTTEAIPAKGTLKDNVVGVPNFKDGLAGDYRLAPGSAAIDAGVECVNVSNDFVKAARPQNEAWDIGAYEYVTPKLDAAIAIEGTAYPQGSDIVFAAVVGGTDLDGLTYAWDFNGDGTVDSTEANPTWRQPSFGGYRPTLTVRNAAGDTVTALTPDMVSVLPGTVYVSATGTEEYPYDTEEKGTRDLQTAIDSVYATEENPGTVLVGAGDYEIPEDWVIITKPVTVKGVDGPQVTTLHARNSNNVSGNPGYGYRRRVMLVNHPQAFVTGLGMTDGWVNESNADGAGPGGLRLIDGVVSNCWIYSNIGSDNSGGVDMKGGLLTHCEIFGNTAKRTNNGNIGNGGGVSVSGGLVTHCVISNNTSHGGIPTHTKRTGGGVYQTGGTVEDCLIAFNTGSTAANRAGAGVALKGGLMDRCRIVGNTTAQYGGGVYFEASSTGILRNCLVAGNEAQDNGGGVYVTAGTVDSCTIVANKSTNKLGGGLYQKGGTVKNTIVYNNDGDPAADANCNVLRDGGTFENNISDRAPGFVYVDASDWKLSDWTLAAGSPAIDTALPDDTNVMDLNGALRPKDGNGDGEAVNDIGCFEAKGADEGPFSVAITFTKDSALDVLETTLTANLSGDGSKDLDNITYEWTLDEGGTIVSEPADAQTVTVRYTTAGNHSASVKATHGSDSATDTKAVFKVGVRKIHVSLEGGNRWPYASWEDAATDVIEAFRTMVPSEERIEVVVADGTYPVNDLWLQITGNIYFHSANGPSSTTLKAANAKTDFRRVLKLDSDLAVVEGFTMTGGNCLNNPEDGLGPGALRLLSGTVTNCVITDNWGEDNSGGVDMRGGFLLNSTISKNTAKRTNNASCGVGGGIRLKGGTVENCVIADNYAQQQGAGIYVDGEGAIVRNCVITNNTCGNNHSNVGNSWPELDGAGIWMSAGLVENCRIVGNKNYHWIGKDRYADTYTRGEGAVYVSGTAELRNSLVAGNLCDMGAQGILVEGADAKVVNCTVAGNGDPGFAYKDVVYESVLRSGLVANTIIYGNDGESTTTGTATLDHSRVNEDPFFRNPAKGDYRVHARYDGCFETGEDSYWSGRTGAKDLQGVSRIFFRHVDIGCFECTTGGLMLLVR